ncbi:hypothetical protein JW926_18175 [Candidatus Sumerlaeota bacterium]|nr:hypothetical protein [Candidatus Sumerlaeota bacterium]
MDEKIEQAAIARAFDDNGKLKITCKGAFEIAKEFGVEPVVIGKICNQKKIKICKCQLGCFK